MVMMMLWSTALAAPQAPRELTLDEAVMMTLASNPTGKIAVFDFEAAKGSLTAARSGRWPTVAGTHKDSWTWAGANASRTTYGDPNYVSDQFSNAITARWTLWSGNAVESQISQAKLALDSSQ